MNLNRLRGSTRLLVPPERSMRADEHVALNHMVCMPQRFP